MKITPYLLWLNGFEPYEGRTQCWRRVETNPLTTNTIEMMIEPACINGLWVVHYKACDTTCKCYLKTFKDLMALSEVFARNRHGYTDVNPIEIYVPAIYVGNNWERWDLDQELFNEKTYQYV